MNAYDHAVVIGISRYADADAQPPWISNLHGPDNDAADVADWLKREDGGGLPEDNVRVIRSADFVDPTNMGPQQQAVVDEFTALKELPTTAYENGGQYAGRRLYVYASGHGFAAEREQAAVITAEAVPPDPMHVLVTDYLDWLWYAARFKEYVLWVDTCSTRQPRSSLNPCPWEREFRGDTGEGRRFVAFAAPFGKTAVEAELEGAWHGVFTYALLKALNGARGGHVRSDDVHDYLHNSLKTFMTEAQLKDDLVGHEPAFGTTDDLEFATLAESKFAMTLRFPQECVGKKATITVNASSPLVDEIVLQQPDWEVALNAGAYVAYVPELDLTHAFVVTRGGLEEVRRDR